MKFRKKEVYFNRKKIGYSAEFFSAGKRDGYSNRITELRTRIMRPDQLGQIPTLAFYLHCFKMSHGGNEQADILNCIPQNNPEYDYHEILRQAENDVRTTIDRLNNMGMWHFGEILNIDDVDIDREDYEVIARQIYPPNPVPWENVHWENHPPVNHVNGNVFEHCYDDYINTLSGSEDTRNSVDAIIDRLNSLLVENNTNRINGLVVGRVQSGKTQNFTALQLKAISQQWNMIIVLTSDNTALASQTRDRLAAAFKKAGLRNNNNSELNFLQNAANPSIQVLPNYVYWGVAMKESNSLDRIIRCFDHIKQENLENLENLKVLVIDDEADNATPNSAGNRMFTEDEIGDYLDSLRNEDRENIADWLDDLLDFDIPENKEEQTPFQKTFLQLLDNCSVNNLFNFLYNHRDYLNMSYQNENGENVDVYAEITKYYTRQNGNHLNSKTVLRDLLRSVFGIAQVKSTINHKICKIIDVDAIGQYSYPFRNCAYIGYTATPYACVFNERPDQTPIYPGFIYSLKKGSGYFGLDEIFGFEPQHFPPSKEPRMPIVYTISEDENRHILEPLRKNVGNLEIDENLSATHDGQSFEWTSLKKMIQWAFCAAAARRHARIQRLQQEGISEEDREELQKGLNYRWTSMLVNIDAKRTTHGTVRDLISSYLTRSLGTPESRESFRQECLATWHSLTHSPYLTEEKFRNLFREYTNFVPYPEDAVIDEGLRFFTENCNCSKQAPVQGTKVHVIEINSTPEGKARQCDYVQAEKYPKPHEDVVPKLDDDHLWIISGGNTISRGLTLPGLVSSYFDRIRRHVAVDTMTQMGRWFGYRRGYELLPRLAMTGESVVEIKKVAVIEHKMHDEIEEKFSQNISPSDPTGYLAAYTCGKKLSGRQRSFRTLTRSIGTFATTSHFYLRERNIRNIYEKTNSFVANVLNDYVVERNADEFQYAHYALWSNVPSGAVGSFLNEIRDNYPTNSKLKLLAMQRELENSETAWSVVIGEPENAHVQFPLGDRNYRAGTPNAAVQGDQAMYSNTRLHLPYFAMIPKSKLRQIDLNLLGDHKEKILDELKRTDPLPADLNAVLQDGATTEQRYENTLTYYENNENEPLPTSLHSLLNLVSTSYRNRSASDYIELAHEEEQYRNPILQIYLINPPENLGYLQMPVVSLAFYWPHHEPSGYVAGSLGMAEDFLQARRILPFTEERFYGTVRDILLERNFPMSKDALLDAVFERLGCRVEESPRLTDPERMTQYGYESFPGRKAFCLTGWATANNHEDLLDQAFCEAAKDFLKSQNEAFQTEQLMQRIIDENPKFKGLYDPKVPGPKRATIGTGKFNNMFNTTLFETKNWPIRVTCRRPMCYQYDHNYENGEE